jgi:hypothetical protein
MTAPRGIRNKVLDVNSKPAKYLLAKQKGLTKREAELEVYGTDYHNSRQIERTESYKTALEEYKDVLEKAIPLKDTAEYHADNIRQDKDKGARNTAIKMKYEISGLLKEDAENTEDTGIKLTIINPILNDKER